MKKPTLAEWYDELDECFDKLMDWENWQFLRAGQAETEKNRIMDNVLEDAHEYGPEYVRLLENFKSWASDANQLTRRISKPERPEEE